MTEAFLYYLWQHRLFDTTKLKADDGSVVEVVKPGVYNTGSGPDFFNAKLRLNGIHWAGNVEIHIRSSDWVKHHHHKDPVYDSCILHVVLENDCPTVRMNGSVIPTIALKDRYPDYVWRNYIQLIGKHGMVACSDEIYRVDASAVNLQLEKMTEERLNMKAEQVLIAAGGMMNDWEECFYQLLARNFGFHVNALPFEMLARSLPFRIIQREKSDLTGTESIFFGQAGMLEEEMKVPYYTELKKEYSFYRNKYNLKPIHSSSWKYMRLRPVNFPTIRIAQFSDLMFRSSTLFSTILSSEEPEQLIAILDCHASEFWNDHYTFQATSPFLVKRVGEASLQNIIINTVVPVMKAWSIHVGQKEFAEKALHLLKLLPAEDNSLVREWGRLGLKPASAADSQALLQLRTLHCAEKKCLSCSICNQLINSIP